MGDKDTVISTIEGEGPIDGYWQVRERQPRSNVCYSSLTIFLARSQVIWSSVGADSSDPDL